MNKKRIIAPLTGLIFGLVWGIFYLFFSVLHGMVQMFNGEFIFLTATIFSLQLTTKLAGFMFAFIDGFIVGVIFGLIFTKVTN